MVNEEQAKAYFKEAELTLASAQAIFKEAKNSGTKLWSKVVKEAYDAMKNCVVACLALKKLRIPRYHPAKITSFIVEYGLERDEIAEILRKWLAKRSRAQYVDFNATGKLRVPHEEFNEKDAVEALRECNKVINFVMNLLSEKRS